MTSCLSDLACNGFNLFDTLLVMEQNKERKGQIGDVEQIEVGSRGGCGCWVCVSSCLFSIILFIFWFLGWVAGGGGGGIHEQ